MNGLLQRYGLLHETWEGETLEDAHDMLDSLKTAEDEATGGRAYAIWSAIADLEDQIGEAEAEAEGD